MRAVLFDLDGVLIHSSDAWFWLLHSLAARMGYPKVQRGAFDASFGQGVQADIAEFFPNETPEGLALLYDQHFLDHAEHIAVDPHAHSVFASLKKSGLGVAVVTNTPRPLAVSILERINLRPDCIFGPGGELKEKPSPDMLLEACAVLGVSPSEAMMIGDSRYDRGAAAAAGTGFVGVGIDGDARVENLSTLLATLGL